jgi:hypothetical protein
MAFNDAAGIRSEQKSDLISGFSQTAASGELHARCKLARIDIIGECGIQFGVRQMATEHPT